MPHIVGHSYLVRGLKKYSTCLAAGVQRTMLDVQ